MSKMCFYSNRIRKNEILEELRYIALLVDKQTSRSIAHYEGIREEFERINRTKTELIEVLNLAGTNVPEDIKFDEIPVFLKKILGDKKISYIPTQGKKNSYTIFEVNPDED